MKDFEFFACPKEGCNTTFVRLTGEGTLTCEGEELQMLEAGTVDAAKEKHVPHIVREGNRVDVTVGEVEHPMLEEHHIAFIVLVQGNKTQRVDLEVGQAPKASFEVEEGPVVVYEYCNLHGLWKAEA